MMISPTRSPISTDSIEKGYDITPADVAYKWLELISDGYSAEKTAIENLRRGLLPPESGTTNNYFYDWIGAQMRTRFTEC